MLWGSAAERDELLSALAWSLLGYVVVNYLRSRSATDQGGATFPSTAPGNNVFSDALDILDPMQVSASGQAFIKNNEGLTLTARPDAGGRVIGWGHEIQPGDNLPSTITRSKAEQLFQADLATATAAVNGALTVNVNQDQFDALADLAFNIGPGAFAGSTLVKLLNQGNYAGAAQQFAAWNKSGGQVNSGLQNRRSAEQGMFTG